MTAPASHHTPWQALLYQLAAEFGIADYSGGSLWFKPEDGVPITVEPMHDAPALAVYAGLGRIGLLNPDGSMSGTPTAKALLRANAPRHRRPVCSIDPVDDEIVLFRRLEGPDLDYPVFRAGLDEFVLQVQAALAGHLLPVDSSVPPAAPTHDAAQVAAFESVWSEFVHQRGLQGRTETPMPGDECLMPLLDGGGIVIGYEPADHTVLLKSVLASLPLGDAQRSGSSEDEILRPLLAMHLLGENTAGASFAIDEGGTDGLVLYRRLPVNGLRADVLADTLDRLAQDSTRFCAAVGLQLPVLS